SRCRSSRRRRPAARRSRCRRTCFRPIPKRWPQQTVVVVGGGPSLTAADVDRAASRPVRIIAINDAWRLAPRADLLYAADAPWWDHHKGVPAFAGAKWIPYRTGGCSFSQGPHWLACAKRWGLRIVRSESGTRLSFD